MILWLYKVTIWLNSKVKLYPFLAKPIQKDGFFSFFYVVFSHWFIIPPLKIIIITGWITICTINPNVSWNWPILLYLNKIISNPLVKILWKDQSHSYKCSEYRREYIHTISSCFMNQLSINLCFYTHLIVHIWSLLCFTLDMNFKTHTNTCIQHPTPQKKKTSLMKVILCVQHSSLTVKGRQRRFSCSNANNLKFIS